MLIDDLKTAMFAAMKAKDTITKEVLRTAIGEATATGSEVDDARVTAVLRKLVKSNEETLGASADAEQRQRLERELTVIRQFLPQTLDVEQIRAALLPVAEQVRGAANSGQATGIAMKHLKASGSLVDGKDVAKAVEALRG